MANNTVAVPNGVNWQPADLNVWLTTQPPALDYLFENMFPCGIIAGLGGSGGIGKSTFALQLAYSLASGTIVFEDFVPTRPASVLVFLGEDPANVTWQRIFSINRCFPLTSEQERELKNNLVVYSDKAAPLCISKEGQIKPTQHYSWMKSRVQALQPKLIIIDPKARWSTGNENSNDDATAFVNLLQSLAQPSNASVLVTHHVSKARKDTLDVSSSRGASAFPDATRLFFSMVRCSSNGSDANGEQEVLIHTTKSNFTPRLPKPLVLRHSTEHGGIFEQMPESESSQVVLVATCLAEWLSDNGPMNLSAIRDPRDEQANQLKCFMEERCGSYRKYLDAAIEAGEAQGLLAVESVSTGGRKARQVSAIQDDAVENNVI